MGEREREREREKREREFYDEGASRLKIFVTYEMIFQLHMWILKLMPPLQKIITYTIHIVVCYLKEKKKQ